MKKIKIAQIGINRNSHSNEIFRSICKQSDIFEVVGYVFPENERERLQQKLSWFDADGYPELTLEEVLENPEIEAVTIETDEVNLTKYALMAAKAGKHIHMEKPGGVSLADFEELIGIMKNTGKVFHTGYMYRYNPCIMELMEEIEKGELGEIISIEAQMNCTHPKEIRQWLEAFPGGMMFFLGCHLVDLIYRIKGTPKNIIPLNKCSGLEDVTAEDFGMVVFEYENGVSFAKTTAVEYGGFERRQFVVNGSKKTVELKPLEWRKDVPDLLTTTRIVRDDLCWFNEGKVYVSDTYDRYDYMMKSFAEYLRGEKKNPYTLDYELELFKLLLKCCGK